MLSGWLGESHRHALSARGIKSVNTNTKIKKKYPKIQMGMCQDVNSYAYATMNDESVILVGGEAILDKPLTIVDDMGDIVDTTTISHVWLEKDGKVIDYADHILHPAKIIEYKKEAILDETCQVIEWMEGYEQ